MPFIEAKNLTKFYEIDRGRIRVLDGDDFIINEGDFVLVLGNSGSGKTTLLNLISGLDKASTGQMIIAGQDLGQISHNNLSKWRVNHVGIVFQNFNLIPFMPALDNVALPLAFCGVKKKVRRQKAGTLLNKFGMGHRVHHMPSQLSGGEQQRVALARALINDPQILVADEPTGELDSDNALCIMGLLKTLNQRFHTTIILASHNQDYKSYATRIIHIKDGRVTAQEVK